MRRANNIQIGCVLMAAGSGERFKFADGTQSNKLFAEFSGKRLYEHALDAIPEAEFFRVVVISGYENILNRAKALGFIPIVNDRPTEGVSRTIKLGLNALESADAVLFMTADQPLLRRETVAGEINFFRRNYRHDLIVALGFKGRRGNPVIFSKEYFAELRALTGDVGGRRVIAAHENALMLFEVENTPELEDVDRWEDLLQLGAVDK